MPKKEEKNLEEIVDEVIAENTKALLEIQAGIGSSIDKLVSKVMRKTKIKIDPKKIRQLILSKL
jgi:aspartyl-tRNA(Asn)/glutamyl-tRNA(Gln) amidotransferase subunit B